MISMHFQVYKSINSIPEQIFSKFFHKTSHHLISLYYRIYRLGKSTSLRKTPKNTRKTGIRHIAMKTYRPKCSAHERTKPHKLLTQRHVTEKGGYQPSSMSK